MNFGPNIFTKGVLIIAITILSKICLCQSAGSNANMMPNLVPATPDVAKLAQFGTYPVSHFTGLVNVEIPLYEIKVGELSVPITLRYHTSGVKVTERSGWVGLGWSLEPGGTISRSIMGIADEIDEGYLSNPIQYPLYTSILDDLEYLDDIVRGNIDSEPDIFSFSFGGYSGNFLFNAADSYSKILIPYTPVKIDEIHSNESLVFNTYDPMGINYKFDEIFESGSGVNDYVSRRSAWKVSKIVSPDKSDTISFSYSDSRGRTYTDIIDWIKVEDMVENTDDAPDYFQSNQGISMTSSKAINSNEQKIAEILFPMGKAVFNLTERTEDGWVNTVNGTQKKLSSIYIYSYIPATDSYDRIKVIIFDYGHFTSSDASATKRLKLEAIRIYDGNIAKLEQKYSFDYNTSQNLPEHLSRARDYWGFFNGIDNNTLVPRKEIYFQSQYNSGGSNIYIGSNYTQARESSSSFMKACVLNKITYPTGGWTEFDYECNKYLDGTTLKNAGGLRIYQMLSYDSNGTLETKKTFKYGVNESDYGRNNFLLQNISIENELWVEALNINGCSDPRKRQRIYSSVLGTGIEPYDGAPVVYPEVTVYDGDEYTNNGKTVYKYRDYADNLSSTFAIGVPGIQSNHYKRGLLLSEENHSSDSGNPTTSTKTYNYGAFTDSVKSNIGLKVIKKWINTSSMFRGLGGGMCDLDGDQDSYQYMTYSVKTGDSKPVASSDYSYSSTDETKYVTTSTSYQYGNFDHQQVTKTTMTDSEGQSHIREIEYPHETSGSIYTEMVDRHMIGYPVKETRKIGTTTIDVTTRNYDNPHTDLYNITSIYRLPQGGSNELEIDFQKYDVLGNLLQYEMRDGINSSFVWGYDSTLLIAQAINAEEERVSYSSFEDEPYVYTYNGFYEFDNSKSKTGRYSFKTWDSDANEDFYYTEIKYPIISENTKFKYSVWAYSSGPSVDLFIFWNNNTTAIHNYLGHSHVSSSTTGKWVLLEGEATVPAGTTKMFLRVDNNSGTGDVWFDDFKFYPADAQMTTYTHDPLIGVTSITDPNNQSMHYEFDDFGRLIEVTDSNGDLIQEVEYNFVNQ